LLKKCIAQSLILTYALIFSSCASAPGIQLVNLTAKESSSSTEIVLTTTAPVEFQVLKLQNPLGLKIVFPSSQIFSFEKEVLTIDRGAIKNIKNEFQSQPIHGQYPLKAVFVELAQDLPYETSQKGNTIVLSVKCPEVPKEADGGQKKIDPPLVQPEQENPALEPGYMIGPGDVLNIEFWGQPDLTRDVVVNNLGEIKVPPLTSLNVMGMTVAQLEEKLTEVLAKYYIDPVIYVKIKEYNSQRVISMGEITTGMHTLKRRTTLLEFLGQIGGLTANADTYHIKLIKKDGSISIHNLSDLINDIQKSSTILVSSGDTVYVPPLELNKIFVLGEVKTPKSINIKGKMMLIDALAEAGGFSENAITRSVLVVRGQLGSQKGLRLNVSHLLKGTDLSQNIELQPGDIIYVPKSFIVDVERFLRDISSPLTWYFWYMKY